MRVLFVVVLLSLTFLSCDKDEIEAVPTPLIASMVGSGKINLVLKTEKLYETGGYVIQHTEFSQGKKQIIKLKYVYKRFPTDSLVSLPAVVQIYATAEAEQQFVIKYKNKTANLSVRHDGSAFSMFSDNESFVRPE